MVSINNFQRDKQTKKFVMKFVVTELNTKDICDFYYFVDKKDKKAMAK